MPDTLPRGIKKRFKRTKTVTMILVSLKEWKTGSGFNHSQRRF